MENTNEVVEVVNAEVVEVVETPTVEETEARNTAVAIVADANALTVIPPKIDGNDATDEIKVSEADKYAYILVSLVFGGNVPTDHTIRGFRTFVRSVEKCHGVGKFSYADAAVHYFTKCKEGEKFLSPEMKAEMEKKAADKLARKAEREAAKAKRAEERARKAEERAAMKKAGKLGKKFAKPEDAVAFMKKLNGMFSQTEFQF